MLGPYRTPNEKALCVQELSVLLRMKALAYKKAQSVVQAIFLFTPSFKETKFLLSEKTLKGDNKRNFLTSSTMFQLKK